MELSVGSIEKELNKICIIYSRETFQENMFKPLKSNKLFQL